MRLPHTFTPNPIPPDDRSMFPSPLLWQVDDIDIFRIGPMFENNPVFPARTNTGELWA